MHYKFPRIEHLYDVLPHIEGRQEFIVAERDFGTVVNYVVAFPDTFDMTPETENSASIRRECRGLIFGLDGTIMSRPFHKFFNLNERPETSVASLDFNEPHVILEKADGSMIRPIIQHNKLRLATKMGVTDVAIQAEQWMETQPGLKDWLIDVMEDDATPLFEWVSPENRIVLKYDQPELIYLGARWNVTGEYFFHDDLPTSVKLIQQYGSLGNESIDHYIARARQKTNREGDIIRFADGHAVKVKNDWYVLLHKTKDRIATERNIAAIIVNEELDDLLPILDETDRETVDAYTTRFEAALEDVLGRLEGLELLARTVYSGDKKEVALGLVPNLIHQQDARFIFAALDDKPLRPLVLEHIKKSVGNTARYEALEQWMGLNDNG